MRIDNEELKKIYADKISKNLSEICSKNFNKAELFKIIHLFLKDYDDITDIVFPIAKHLEKHGIAINKQVLEYIMEVDIKFIIYELEQEWIAKNNPKKLDIDFTKRKINDFVIDYYLIDEREKCYWFFNNIKGVLKINFEDITKYI